MQVFIPVTKFPGTKDILKKDIPKKCGFASSRENNLILVNANFTQ